MENNEKQILTILLDKETVYLVFRGTDTKEGFFARDFNIKDSLSSHIGLMVYNHENWVVYNVSDFKDGLSDLKRQKLDEFYDIQKENIKYASIWRLNNVDSLNTIKLIRLLQKYEERTIKFDRYFTLHDSTKLYCSQFIRDILFKTDSVNFNFKTEKRELMGIYKTYFRKDTLEYYPVDIFQTNSNIEMIKEWCFK